MIAEAIHEELADRLKAAYTDHPTVKQIKVRLTEPFTVIGITCPAKILLQFELRRCSESFTVQFAIENQTLSYGKQVLDLADPSQDPIDWALAITEREVQAKAAKIKRHTDNAIRWIRETRQ